MTILRFQNNHAPGKPILDYIRTNLPEYRLNHTLGVRDLALQMARHYGASEEQTAVAALLHDLVRHYTDDQLLELVRRYGWKIASEEEKAPYLLHGPLGAQVARELFGIAEEVASAVSKHTLGDETMSLLDKIIYLADWAEPGRTGETVEQVRSLIFRDIDRAMLLALNETLNYLVRQNLLIHPLTVKARNSFLQGIR